MEAAFLDRLLDEEDASEWPALVEGLEEAARALKVTPDALYRSWLEGRGVLPGAYALWMDRFHRAFFGRSPDRPFAAEPCVNRYPEATAAELDALDRRLETLRGALPPARNAFLFSIDDAGVEEIDDALSVERLEDGRLRVGVHIAAPGTPDHRGERGSIARPWPVAPRSTSPT